MITLADVVLTYPDGDTRVTAVDRASLEARPGEVVALTGPSGSGKSSLLAVVDTLVRPDSGSVVLDGTDVTELDAAGAARLRREKLGIVFQQSHLLPSLSVRDQLAVMAELGGRSPWGALSGATRRSRARAAARAEELLDAVGLEDQRHKRLHQLSGGQRQRVNIARAFMNDPSVLVVDEPTSALDRARSAEIVDLVVRLTRQAGTSTLFVTHDVEFLPSLDRVVEIVDGRLTEREPAVG